MKHRSGFVNIIGKPNAGKSTLMNLLVGEKLAATTFKAQTTRERILGIVNDKHYQIVYSDTPGFVANTKSGLHERMNSYVKTAIGDADILLYLIDFSARKADPDLEAYVQKAECPVFILLNKVDLADSQDDVSNKISEIKEDFPGAEVSAVSALHNFNLDGLFERILEKLPEGPAWFPKDQLTNKTQRFFAAEIMRAWIFTSYDQEIPYACQVEIEHFKEGKKLIHIEGFIYVERESQKGIIIGSAGKKLKGISINARKEMETFFNKRVFLRLQVKVRKDWRNDDRQLRKFGFHGE